MALISFISPYPEINKTIKETFEKHPERLKINYKIITKTFEEIRENDLATDIIIARGYTVDLLKKYTTPVIDMTVTGFDIIIALSKCIHEYSPDRIAIIGPINTVYGIDEIRNIFNCKITPIHIDNPENISTEIHKFIHSDKDAVISGLAGCLICKKMGINCTLIESGKRSIYQAIDEAIRSIKIMEQEREKSDRFDNIMNYTFEGIIIADSNGNISSINSHAKNLFEESGKSTDNTSIYSLLPGLDVKSVISRKTKILGDLMPIQNQMHTVNCVPSGHSSAIITFTDVSKIQKLEEKIRKKMHPKGLSARYHFSKILGKSELLLDAVRIARKFSHTESNIFIFGETGTGKELFAQSIHNESHRKNNPFIAVNCAALPEELLESELFGYVDGAFTGALKGGKSGLFELAHNGTIFLDEIGDISPKLQSRLLRVIQEREIMRIGHDRIIPVNIRIISASNKNLNMLVEQGRFREDLLYRLNVLKLTLPALRFRRIDIPILCEHFFSSVNTGYSKVRGFTQDALRLITEYDWPGNIRELSNFCERLSALCEDEIADVHAVNKCLEPSLETGAPGLRRNLEKELIKEAIGRARTKKEAAHLLHIDPSTLWRKMKKLNL